MRQRETPKVEALSTRLTNPYEIHIHDLVKGFRHLLRGKDSIHREAFEVYLCRVAHAVLRLDSMVEDYLDAMAEAAEK